MARKKQSTKSQKKRAKVPRKTLSFQMRLGNEEDEFVREIVGLWKKKRKGLKHFRKAVQILYALELFEDEGDEEALKVLMEMFPRLRERFSPALADLIQQFSTMMVTPRPAENPALTHAIPTPPPKLLLIEDSDMNTSNELLSQFL